MQMKLSSGAKIALGLGALVIVYLVVKNSQGSVQSTSAAAAPDLALPAIQPISSAGIVAIDVQPSLTPMTLQLN